MGECFVVLICGFGGLSDNGSFDIATKLSDFSSTGEIFGQNDNSVMSIKSDKIENGSVTISSPVSFVPIPANFVVNVDLVGETGGKTLTPIIDSVGVNLGGRLMKHGIGE